MASVSTALLTDILAYARESVAEGFETNFFYVSPIISRMAALNREGAYFGGPVASREGTAGLVGGSQLSPAVRREILNDFQTSVRIQTGLTGGTKWMGTDDTLPSNAGNTLDKNLTSVGFRNAHVEQAMQLRGSVMRYNKEKKVFGSYVSQTVKEAVEELNLSVGYHILCGVCPDRTATEWGDVDGILQCLLPAGVAGGLSTATPNTTGTYGYGGDPTVLTRWVPKCVVGSEPMGLSLVDDANLNQGIQAKGPGIDSAFVSFQAFAKLKSEARNLNAVNLSVMKDGDECWKHGVIRECIIYNGCVIQPDPFLADYTTANVALSPNPASTLNLNLTNCFIGLTLGTWTFGTHPEGNWSPQEWITQYKRGAGAVDAWVSWITAIFRLACHQRWNNIIYPNCQI